MEIPQGAMYISKQLISLHKTFNPYNLPEVTENFLCTLALQQEVLGISDYTLYETIDQLIPKSYIVYKLFLKGELVYIGSTTDINSRLSAHAKDKVFDNVNICLTESKDYMLKLEQKLILVTSPPLNKGCNLSDANKYCGNLEDEQFIEYEDYYQELKVKPSQSRQIQDLMRNSLCKFPSKIIKPKNGKRAYIVVVSDMVLPTFREGIYPARKTTPKLNSNYKSVNAILKSRGYAAYLKEDSPMQGLHTFNDKFVYSDEKWREKGSNKWYKFYGNSALADKMINDLNRKLDHADKKYKKANIFGFGKYKGYTIANVAEKDPQYIEWCINNLPEGVVTSLELRSYVASD